MNDCEKAHPWVKTYCPTCGWKPEHVVISVRSDPEPSPIVPELTYVAQGPTVDISEAGEPPMLMSANRKARRAAKAHAR